MKKLFNLMLCLSLSTASALGSEAVFQYKYSMTVASVEKSAPKSLISKYLVNYSGLRVYNPKYAPKEFNGVVATISTKPRSCKYNSFEYDLYINKTLWEMSSIQDSVKKAMKASGYRAIKTNEFGVTMWETLRKEYAVTFTTKLTPFTYVNSICKV